jgi:hypothetical protein
LKPVTTCIAAICDSLSTAGIPPAIIFCADRLVSAGIQFESGTAKIKILTNYCFTMQSSNDSLTSDMILEKVKAQVSKLENPISILEIVNKIRDECFTLKKQWIENNILYKYNLTLEKLGSKPEGIIKDAVNEVRDCQYPYTFSFIVLGLEPTKEAHLYTIDQDGEYWLQDSLGFATIGSGGNLAFLELTKHEYTSRFPAVMAIPRIYLAKKVSERAEGVGRHTDLVILFFSDPKSDKFDPRIQELSATTLIPTFDEAYKSLVAHEKEEIDKLNQVVYEMLAPKKPEPVETSTTEKSTTA